MRSPEYSTTNSPFRNSRVVIIPRPFSGNTWILTFKTNKVEINAVVNHIWCFWIVTWSPSSFPEWTAFSKHFCFSSIMTFLGLRTLLLTVKYSVSLWFCGDWTSLFRLWLSFNLGVAFVELILASFGGSISSFSTNGDTISKIRRKPHLKFNESSCYSWSKPLLEPSDTSVLMTSFFSKILWGDVSELTPK